MYRAILLIGLLGVCVTGCGPSQAPVIDSPVSVSGTVTASGKPVGNVVLNLQPLENGYTKIIPVKADGLFTVETQSGKYAYFFTPKEGTKTLPAPAASYAQPSLERTVQVAAGKQLEIDLK